jgi:hypothetical protein
MKTNEMIAKLSGDLKPVEGADSSGRFFFKWAIASLLIVTAWLSILPARPELTRHFSQFSYVLESALWLALSANSAFIVYRGRIPSLTAQREIRWAQLAIAVLGVSLIARETNWNLGTQIVGEMDWFRGRCGILIPIMALTWSVFLFTWARKGAPTRPMATGGWIAFSAGCLASFAMQVVCTHENPLHEVIWHVIPVALLAVLGLMAGRRFLRW